MSAGTLHIQAAEKLEKCIDRTRSFPDKVFRDTWLDFFFFDPDWIFEGTFVDDVHSLCNLDGSSVAVISNLSRNLSEQDMYFFDRNSSSNDYSSFLHKVNPSHGWIYGVDKFGCISNEGKWTIYCERENEIAVIAIRLGAPLIDYAPILKRIHAVKINEAIANPVSYGFTDRGLTPDWKTRLLSEYT